MSTYGRNPEITEEGWYTLANVFHHVAFGKWGERDYAWASEVKDIALGYQPALVEPERRVVPCTTTTPEPHERGEFPMSCYACHLYADA